MRVEKLVIAATALVASRSSCCTSLLYSPELPAQEFENYPPSRDSHGFESQTSCLLRNRSGGLA